MRVKGVELDDLPDQFQGHVQGRTLILDGDGPCYVAAATVKRLDTGVRRFQQEVLKRMFLAGAQDVRIHLTARNSDKHGRFRVKAVKPYQGQRDSSKKPPLLEPIREAVAQRENWLQEFDSVILHRELEADDGMIQDAYRLGEHGVINSDDKDLRMTPHLYFEQKTGQVMQSQPVGFVELAYTPSGTPKIVGQGPMFFWGQMLAGDTADNIQGILRLHGQKCGPVGAYEALKDCKCTTDAAQFVLDEYRAINQNPLAEGWLLWLTRWPGDNVLEYFRSLKLSGDNKDFIEDCLRRDWVIPREARELQQDDS